MRLSMIEIKLIARGDIFSEKIFFCIGDAVQFFRESWVRYASVADYLLIINGRRYDWPGIPFNLLELIDHISHCVDMDEAFYAQD